MTTTKIDNAILTDGQIAALRSAVVPGVEVEALIGWAERAVMDYGLLENLLQGHLQIVGVDEAGDWQFRMTKRGREHVDSMGDAND